MLERPLIAAFITLLSVNAECVAQGEAAVPFLLISPYAESNAMGLSSVSTFTDDPLAALDKPAHLGMQSLRNYFSSGYNYNKLLPGFQQSDLWYRTFAFNAGINLKKLWGIEPELGIGAAYSRIRENLGDFIVTGPDPTPLGTYTAYETSDQYTLSIGINYWIKASEGITFKHIYSNLFPPGGGIQQMPAKNPTVDSYDYGFLFDVPIVEVASRISQEPIMISGHWAPLFNLRLGFAKNNLGNKGVTYFDLIQPDPLPRYARIGIGFNLGVRYSDEKVDIQPVSFKWTIEANDILVRRYPALIDSSSQMVLRDASWEYQTGLGDINFFDEVILGRGNPQTIKKKGWELTFGGLFSLRGGRFEEDPNHGNRHFSTSGWGFRTSGITKWIGSENVFGFILNHVDIRYDHSDLTTDEVDHPLSGTTFDSVQILVLN